VQEIKSVSKEPIKEQIANAVVNGFARTPKALPGWLLYDDFGDRLFQQIMELPEYYPTRCELQIFQRHKGMLLKLFASFPGTFQLIELGAGDGRKTEVLLRYLLENRVDFEYVPTDVSSSVLSILATRLRANLPAVKVRPTNINYLQSMESLGTNQRKVVMFLGSTIGNYPPPEATDLLKRLAGIMGREDMSLIGVDLKKDPQTILRAYDDPGGVTREFNLNSLRRINRELNGNFDLSQFVYHPTYNPVSGALESYLVSKRRQHVLLRDIDLHIDLASWEAIRTEISQKYDFPSLSALMKNAGLQIVEYFLDVDGYFADVLVSRV